MESLIAKQFEGNSMFYGLNFLIYNMVFFMRFIEKWQVCNGKK